MLTPKHWDSPLHDFAEIIRTTNAKQRIEMSEEDIFIMARAAYLDYSSTGGPIEARAINAIENQYKKRGLCASS